MTASEALHGAFVKLERAACVVRRVIGVPDYDTYVAYLEAHHPGTVPPTREEFTKERQASKYSKPGARCC